MHFLNRIWKKLRKTRDINVNNLWSIRKMIVRYDGRHKNYKNVK